VNNILPTICYHRGGYNIYYPVKPWFKYSRPVGANRILEFSENCESKASFLKIWDRLDRARNDGTENGCLLELLEGREYLIDRYLSVV